MFAFLAKTHKIARDEMRMIGIDSMRATGRGHIRIKGIIDEFEIVTDPKNLRGRKISGFMALGPSIPDDLIRMAEHARGA